MNEVASTSLRVACLQVNAGTDMSVNLETALSLAGEARNDGADFVLMPENVAMMECGRENIVTKARRESEHDALFAFRALARDSRLWVHTGSLSVLLDDGMLVNRSYLFSPDGVEIARYDKIHMFDVDLGGGESYRESSTFRPGSRAVVARTPWGGLGMSICYDLRFPHLYRLLAQNGASFLVIPAAFTKTTGQAHWHVLLRARAIETGSYVFAPAQCGRHAGGRETYGHSLIISPWGEIIADGGEEPGFIIADIVLNKVIEARQAIPSLCLDRPILPPVL